MIQLVNIFIVFYLGTALGNVITGPTEIVQGENYIYYNLTSIDSFIFLELVTLTGDCDLYVSETSEFPTYKDYTLHSATCGVDSVLLLKRSKGPVHIGIYGHPAYETSECVLNVCLLENEEADDEFWDEFSESSKLTDSVIEQKCKKQESRSSAVSYLRRSVDILTHIVATIELDGTLLEIAGAFMQAAI